jgi:thiosulfate dehydrogenase [quinone] large subunit
MISPHERAPGDPASLDANLGYALLRLTLGVNFLFHSFSRWHDGGKFVAGVVGGFAHTPLPVWSVRAFASVVPYWEPAVGLLLVSGLWTRWALVAGALLIALLTFGTALRGEYPVLSEQLVYAVVFFALLLFRSQNDRFGIDGWRAKLR